MSIQQEIEKAIAAHGAWKQKLRSAIDLGTSESTPDKVCKDNNCSFGKWLHERIDPSAKDSPFYPTVLKLHAQFHVAAADILTLALRGEKEKANELMGLTKDFAKYSGELTRKMKEWHDTV
ncbi:MAG: CZB domain-containing protein [Pseudomonadales bacterium]|nr:CZB domain-containing protein [Pseudomonadales bacterium]